MRRLCYVFALAMLCSPLCYASKVDTVEIPSAAMNKTYKAAIAFPDSYYKAKKNFPVLYLLHGGFGHFNDWLNKTPDKMLVRNLADQYNMIIVMPEGEIFSYYIDSPVDPNSKFETYIIKEVIPFIDSKYRTMKDKKGRVITGLSMGGYGSLYLSTSHPDLFAAAGSMSGALDPNMTTWNLTPERFNGLTKFLDKIMGPMTPDSYLPYSVVNMADQIRKNGLPIVMDIGVEDFLLEPNRELHRRLVYNHTLHDYTERPGGHTWEFWQDALPYQVLYFSKRLKANGVML
ncbi:alpha/beta hydrolase [Mucilaginibacter ginsenosidivorax]|uniref:Esterase family protein n=1 Tax=Mucilaginibacter ginsenosidivorax TaxID=862126 RepID=A0A5B8VVD9_9SPHI|nr:alpha/beta hydrolase-fold protein [Mucilaginibacter ginsenosidivorax]QEC75243.1 esterase family protein [Mucilaginibacter ginsenosidivorax]